jgi:hypothetical protein
VTVAVVEPFALSVTDEGETEQTEAAGAPPQDSETDCAKPEIEEISTVKLVDCPATTVSLAAWLAMLKSGTMPVPLSSTTCGLPGTLSVMVNAPGADPAVVGEHVTVITQSVEGCKGAWVQLSDAAKSLLATTPDIVRDAVPTLVTVIVCGALVVPMDCAAKVRLDADNCTVEVLPVNATTCVVGLPFSVSAMFKFALRKPTAVGANVTLKLH